MTSLIHEIYFAACKLQEHILLRNPEFHLVLSKSQSQCRMQDFVINIVRPRAEPQKLSSTSISPTFSGAFAPRQIASVHATRPGRYTSHSLDYLHACSLLTF